MTTTQELLESSFELNLSNYGPEDVERLNDWAIKAHNALEALQAEHTDEVMRGLMLEKAHAMGLAERNAALARLAEIDGQPHIAWKHDDFDHAVFQQNCPKFPESGWHKLYAAAGASPVEPLTKTQIEKGMMALLWCAASDLERLNPNMYECYKGNVTRVYSAITTETTRNS